MKILCIDFSPYRSLIMQGKDTNNVKCLGKIYLLLIQFSLILLLMHKILPIAPPPQIEISFPCDKRLSQTWSCHYVTLTQESRRITIRYRHFVFLLVTREAMYCITQNRGAFLQPFLQWTKTSITYSECVSVTSVMRH